LYKIKNNSAQIQTLEKLRDNLLPKLMSGEIKLNFQLEQPVGWAEA
jgi:type I restriction enzyme S subunit